MKVRLIPVASSGPIQSLAVNAHMACAEKGTLLVHAHSQSPQIWIKLGMAMVSF